MGERATPAGELFRWRPAGVGRRGVPCPRCDGKRTAVRLLENLLEALCATCGRSLALERFRVVERGEGKDGLVRRLLAAGALDATDAAAGPDGALPGLDALIERGALRRDLRLTLDLDGKVFAYGAAPLRDLVLPEEVERALDDRRERGGVLPELLRERVLDRLGATLRSVGLEHGLEALTDPDAIDPACRRALPSRALEVFRAVPVRRDEGALVVAMWDPLDDALVADLEALVGGPVHAILAEPDTLRRALHSLGVAAPGPPSDDGEPEAAGRAPDEIDDESDPFEAILLEALEEGASEVLVEPRQGGASLRFRVGGELRKERALSPDVPAAFVERLLETKRGPREGKDEAPRILAGRARCEVSGLPVAFEYRVLVTPQGPAVAIALDAEEEDAAAPGLSQLGLGLDSLAAFEAALARGAGIIVVAAPPRGGKTSAYQAVLERAQRLGGSIISLERRARRPLTGVVQLELERALDLDALLRPAPDWLGVDAPLEGGPARVATDVALGGGAVVLTITAPDARSALSRLHLAGLPRDLLAAHVRVVLARRVVPRTCARCRVRRQPGGSPSRRFSVDVVLPQDLASWVGLGCPACADLGTSGTLALAELCRPTADGASVEQVKGSTPLAQRAAELMRAGDVPLESVVDLL